jgi:hypothetical protein
MRKVEKPEMIPTFYTLGNYLDDSQDLKGMKKGRKGKDHEYSTGHARCSHNGKYLRIDHSLWPIKCGPMYHIRELGQGCRADRHPFMTSGCNEITTKVF